MRRRKMDKIVDNFCYDMSNKILCKDCPIREYKCYAPLFCTKKELKAMVKKIKKFKKKGKIK